MEDTATLTGRKADATVDARWTRLAVWMFVTAGTASGALRLLYLAQPWRIDRSEVPVFLADEGVVGLMARHILQGERPVFFYGQQYLGALEAYLAAAVFRVFGESMTALRAVPTVFALTWVPLTYAIGVRLYGRRAALLAAALVALPSLFVFEWGFKARGGFAEHVALMLALLYLVLAPFDEVSSWRVAAVGFLSGLAVWVNQLALAYVPVYAYALWVWAPLRRRHVAVLVVAAAIGMAPLIYGNVIEPLSTVRALAIKVRSSYSPSRASPESATGPSFRGLPILAVLGAQDGRSGAWSASGSITALFLVWAAFAEGIHALRARGRREWRPQHLLCALVVVSVLVGAAGFAGQPVGRYQLVLYPLLAVLAVGWLERKNPGLAIVAIAVFLVSETITLAVPGTPAQTTSPETVLAKLAEKGLHNGYGGGSMYDLVFRSKENVVIVPLDKFRYQPDETRVVGARDVFYLYRDDEAAKLSHRTFLATLDSVGIRYRRMDIGDYHLLYQFEPEGSVTPQLIAKVRDGFRSAKDRE